MTKPTKKRATITRDVVEPKPAPVTWLARSNELRTSPLGNLLLEDAAASKQHGRMTARIGVLDDGNPIIYSTDPVTRAAVVKAVQERTSVRVMDIPEVSEADFQKLLRDGVGSLPPRLGATPPPASPDVPPATPPASSLEEDLRYEVVRYARGGNGEGIDVSVYSTLDEAKHEAAIVSRTHDRDEVAVEHGDDEVATFKSGREVRR